MPEPIDLSILRGAYDLHVHASPDVVPRAQDAWDLADAAADAGMAGIVLKDHTTSTVGRAHLLNRRYPGGPRFFAAVTLNPPVGLLNPAAVEAALRAGAAFVFFPTYAARCHVQRLGATSMRMPLNDPDTFQGVTVLDDAGRVRPEADAILRLIAGHDAVLATGHLAPEESLTLLDHARALGVRRMVVTHASESVPDMSVDDQRRAARLGAAIEHCFLVATPCCPGNIPLAAIRDQILALGPQHVVLSSDFGQPPNGPPVAGFARHLQQLQGLGLDTDTLRQMIAHNPARLLDGRPNRETSHAPPHPQSA